MSNLEPKTLLSRHLPPQLRQVQPCSLGSGDKFANLVVGISVGSEDLYRTSETGVRNNAGPGQSSDQMIDFIQQVRDAINGTALKDTPVGHVDTWSAWTNTSNKAVIKAVDFIGADLCKCSRFSKRKIYNQRMKSESVSCAQDFTAYSYLQLSSS
jgi:hypothetical protein